MIFEETWIPICWRLGQVGAGMPCAFTNTATTCSTAHYSAVCVPLSHGEGNGACTRRCLYVGVA